jgi:serine protease Do
MPGSVRGVVVNDIDENSNGYQAGLRRGDVIEEVARQPVTNVVEYNAALKRTGNKSVLLSVRRQQGLQYIVVRPQE